MHDEVPSTASFRQIVLAPYTELLDSPNGRSDHRGGPIWPDWDQQTWPRHQRRGRPVDARPAEEEVATDLDEPIAWGGPIVNHFGHQIADFSMRILPSVSTWPSIPLAFSSHPRFGYASLKRTPRFFQALLRWFGVAPEQTRLISETTRVTELFVAAQTEQLNGPGPSPASLDRLDDLVDRHWPKISRTGTVYVSRAGVRGRFPGEAYLERMLSAAGVWVLRPETVVLEEQIRAYASASTLVFGEGSAMHGTQLLGRSLGDVVVLERRRGKRHAEASLAPRSKSLRYLEVSKSLVHGVTVGGRPATARGMSILDTERLLVAFADLGIDLKRSWRQRDFDKARDTDAMDWVRFWITTKHARAPSSAKTVLSTLETSGLGHLIPAVKHVIACG